MWTIHLLNVKPQRDAEGGLRTRACKRITLDSLCSTFKIQLHTHTVYLMLRT